jgi:MoaA/NifB/PqqE/SkfB family radical SAM enzyme
MNQSMEKRFLGKVPIPLKRVHLELTNICDMDCLFCPKAYMKRPPGIMQTSLAKGILSELGAKKVCDKVTFHVMGEPTLHPDFFQILEHAHAEGVKVGLTTNGAKLGGPIGKKLLQYHLHQIDVSLQTPDEQSFALRKARSLTFPEYRDGVLEFFAEYHKRWPDTIFKFRFLNTRFAKKSIEKKVGPIKVISSTQELRRTFRLWAGRIYNIVGFDEEKREKAFAGIERLVSYKWNVVEVYPNVFFETYVLDDWGHAFEEGDVRDAWAGYCFGMKDHFSILYNGDVTLCCIDFDGQTAIGNLRESTLEKILSSAKLGEILAGFRRYRLVHPYCKKCLGSRSLASSLIKPIASVVGLTLLKPFFYRQIRIYE